MGRVIKRRGGKTLVVQGRYNVRVCQLEQRDASQCEDRICLDGGHCGFLVTLDKLDEIKDAERVTSNAPRYLKKDQTRWRGLGI
jgi:hypothetical protein